MTKVTCKWIRTRVRYLNYSVKVSVMNSNWCMLLWIGLWHACVVSLRWRRTMGLVWDSLVLYHGVGLRYCGIVPWSWSEIFWYCTMELVFEILASYHRVGLWHSGLVLSSCSVTFLVSCHTVGPWHAGLTLSSWSVTSWPRIIELICDILASNHRVDLWHSGLALLIWSVTFWPHTIELICDILTSHYRVNLWHSDLALSSSTRTIELVCDILSSYNRVDWHSGVELLSWSVTRWPRAIAHWWNGVWVRASSDLWLGGGGGGGGRGRKDRGKREWKRKKVYFQNVC